MASASADSGGPAHSRPSRSRLQRRGVRDLATCAVIIRLRRRRGRRARGHHRAARREGRRGRAAPAAQDLPRRGAGLARPRRQGPRLLHLRRAAPRRARAPARRLRRGRHARRAAPARRARRGQGGRRHRLVRAHAVLHDLAPRLRAGLDQDGQGSGPRADPDQGVRTVRPPQVLPGLRAGRVRRAAQGPAQARQARDRRARRGARRRGRRPAPARARVGPGRHRGPARYRGQAAVPARRRLRPPARGPLPKSPTTTSPTSPTPSNLPS